MGGFGISMIVNIILAFMPLYSNNGLQLGVNQGTYSAISLVSTIAMLAVAAGFALMWLMGRRLIHLAVAGSVLVSLFLPIILARYVGEVGLDNSLLISFITGLYIFVWAIGHLSSNVIVSAALVASPIIGTLSTVLYNYLYMDLGVNNTILALLIKTPVALLVIGIKIFALMNESDKA